MGWLKQITLVIYNAHTSIDTLYCNMLNSHHKVLMHIQKLGNIRQLGLSLKHIHRTKTL